MRILYATAEALPYFKTGGLADVSRSLPDALFAAGHDMRIIHPFYEGITAPPALAAETTIDVPWPGGSVRTEFLIDDTAGRAPAVLVRQPAFFETIDPYIDHAADALAQGVRFAFFARAVIAYARARAVDVVHLNDWHTGLAPIYALIDGCPAPTVFAVHNLAYQGNYPPAILGRIGVPAALMRTENGIEFHGNVSFMKAGLALADQLVTVSPGYAREIRTPTHGAGFDGLLRFRHRLLHGILNGIDRDTWNPARDEHLPARYHARALDGKQTCRSALLDELGLSEDGPLIVTVTRLVFQKGIDVLLAAWPRLSARGVRLAVLGSGDASVERNLRRVHARTPDRFAVVPGFNEPLAHRMYAGGDFFVMPSRYEPCGLGQMIAQRYGTPPIATRTGGLADTIQHGRTGFLATAAEPDALIAAAADALAKWQARDWPTLQRRCMRLDWSWSRSARHYEHVYHLAIGAGSA